MDYDPTIQDKFEFCVSLRFELPAALRNLTDPKSRIHKSWKETAKAALPKSFQDDFTALGGAPALWLLVPDTLDPLSTFGTFDELRAELAGLAPEDLRLRILYGLLQDDAVVADVIEGADLMKTLNGSTRANAWLTTVGLYPASKKTPFVGALRRLVSNPEDLSRPLLAVVDAFWKSAFQRTWKDAQEQLRRSMERTDRFFRSVSLAEFAHSNQLRVRADEQARELRATRSEHRVPFARIKAAYVMPSMFNESRTWSIFEPAAGGTVIHLSCFDPAISTN